MTLTSTAISPRAHYDQLCADAKPSRDVVSPYRWRWYYRNTKTNSKVGDQVKLRMIFIKKAAPATTDTEPATPECRRSSPRNPREARRRRQFESLAKLYFHWQGAKDGGDWGWVGRDMLRKELNEVPSHSSGPAQQSDRHQGRLY